MRIVRITKDVSPTNTALNQFAIIRGRVYPNSNEILVTLKNDSENIVPAKYVTLIESKGQYFLFYRNIKSCLLPNNGTNDDVILHIHYPVIGFWALLLNRFIYKSKSVFTIHNTYHNYKFRHKIISRINMWLTDKVVFCGQSSYESFQKLLCLPRKKLTTITNGVDLPRIDQIIQSVQIEKRSSVFRLLSIAKSNKQKNIPFLLNVFEKLEHDAELVLIGPLDHESMNLIQRSAKKDQIVVKGRIPREDVYKEMLGSDFFVSASLWEGLPIGVLEAMACGLPCILSDIDPHMELKKKCSELKVIMIDEELWIDEMLEMLNLSNEKLTAIGHSHRKAVERYFSFITMHDQYDKLYRDLIETD